MTNKTNKKNKSTAIETNVVCGQDCGQDCGRDQRPAWKYENLFWHAVDLKSKGVKGPDTAGKLDASVTRVVMSKLDIDGDTVFSALVDNFTEKPFFKDGGQLVKDVSTIIYTTQFERPGDFVEYVTELVKDSSIARVITQMVKDPLTKEVILDHYNVSGYKMVQLELVKDSSIAAPLELVKDSSIARILVEYLDLPGVKQARVELVKDSSIASPLELVKDSSIASPLELVKDSSIAAELVKDSSIAAIMTGLFSDTDLVRGVLELVDRYFLVLLTHKELVKDSSIAFEVSMVGHHLHLSIADGWM